MPSTDVERLWRDIPAPPAVRAGRHDPGNARLALRLQSAAPPAAAGPAIGVQVSSWLTRSGYKEPSRGNLKENCFRFESSASPAASSTSGAAPTRPPTRSRASGNRTVRPIPTMASMKARRASTIGLVLTAAGHLAAPDGEPSDRSGPARERRRRNARSSASDPARLDLAEAPGDDRGYVHRPRPSSRSRLGALPGSAVDPAGLAEPRSRPPSIRSPR